MSPNSWLDIGLVLISIGFLTSRRFFLAAGASRCPHCGSKFHSVPVCGDRHYQRWYCRACDRDWDERYEDWDPRTVERPSTGHRLNPRSGPARFRFPRNR